MGSRSRSLVLRLEQQLVRIAFTGKQIIETVPSHQFLFGAISGLVFTNILNLLLFFFQGQVEREVKN